MAVDGVHGEVPVQYNMKGIEFDLRDYGTWSRVELLGLATRLRDPTCTALWQASFVLCQEVLNRGPLDGVGPSHLACPAVSRSRRNAHTLS